MPLLWKQMSDKTRFRAAEDNSSGSSALGEACFTAPWYNQILSPLDIVRVSTKAALDELSNQVFEQFTCGDHRPADAQRICLWSWAFCQPSPITVGKWNKGYNPAWNSALAAWSLLETISLPSLYELPAPFISLMCTSEYKHSLNVSILWGG